MELTILDAVTNPANPEKISTFIQNVIDWLLNSGIKILFIIGIAYLIKILSKRFIQRICRAAVSSDKLSLEEAEIKRMNTLVRIFSWTINTLIIVIASMMVLQEFGVKIAPILASAGIVGVAIGFGGQYLVRDVITGFFIILENQYRIGDVVTIEGISGSVEDISLRVTTLRDANGAVHYMPHGEIKRVSNSGKQFSRINLNVGVSYDTSLDRARQVIDRIGQEMYADPEWREMLNEAPHFLRVDDLEDSSVSLKVVGETKPLKQWDVTGELRRRIKETFEREGIEIPYPQRVIHHIGSTGGVEDVD